MTRQIGIAVENNFAKGLVTEATGLNFPQNACTETWNCEFDIDGSVARREGFDIESNYLGKSIERQNEAVSTFLWQNVAGNGDLTLLVAQVGATLYFYETDGSGNFSSNALTTTVELTGVVGAPEPALTEVQYSSGNGLLFVTHPYCDPIRISYNVDTQEATPTSLVLKIRDFEGAKGDLLSTTTRPTASLAGLEINHKYNLLNQGWTTDNLTLWDTAQTTMPSNADVMWRFKDATDNFDASDASIARISAGNTPAVKGHFIVDLAFQNRDGVSGLSGVPSTNTTFYRPSTSAFFAGRVFYAGINLEGFNSSIYFTQIIESEDQYEKCYQVNDPTAEDLFDLLPTDGGVINILEAGSIYKLVTVPGGLCVFAVNGVFFITGSTGIGFTANDYSPQKIGKISTLSATSFVDVGGYPCWWNSEGIYIMTPEQNIPMIKSMTYDTINTFYQEIPILSKKYARGVYNPGTGHIRWIYRSTATSQLDASYEFDRMLNFNTRTGAWYPWTISPSNVKIHSIVSTELITRPTKRTNVVDLSGEFIYDDLGREVVTYTEDSKVNLQFDKFFVSGLNIDGVNQFTFADRNSGRYIDWNTLDNTGINYDSYFISGFKLTGQGIKKFQSNWVSVFSRIFSPVSYFFQGIWDYANIGSETGRWSSRQLITHTDENFDSARKRLKVRGHGTVLQFKVSSKDDQPFDIIGWSSFQSVNGAP